MKLITTFLFIIVATMLSLIAAKDFNEIAWATTLDEAKAEAAASGKNMAVLITKAYCGACKNLKSSFSRDTKDEFEAQAENFVLVHLADDAEPSGSEWRPDGGYIPRLLFADANGNPLPEIKQNNRQKHQYFYHDVFALATALKTADEILN